MSRGDTKLSELKNIGAVSQRMLNDAGIHTVAYLEMLGPVEAYRRVKQVHPEATLNLLYALQGAMLNLNWTALPEDMREELRQRVDH